VSKLSFEDLVAGLRACGLVRGDIVHVQSDLFSLGVVDSAPSRSAILEFYLRGFQEAVGPEGTITTCTAFEDYGRFGAPFVRETSPSRLGAFSEYFRTQPNAVRSLHPVVSVTAIGARAKEICGGNHFDGFGYSSPWGRLHRANAWIMTLGMDANGGGTTFFHYVENLYGVPYQYTKIFSYPVFSEGKEVDGPFTMSVRYLDYGIVNTPQRVKSRMVDLGEAKDVKIGLTKSWCARAGTIVDRMCEMFDENRWMMLVQPPTFRAGEIPMDGQTGEMREFYDKKIDLKEAP